MAIDFQIRDFLHPARIYRLKRLFERHQWMSRAEIESYQVERLRAVLSAAQQQVPFYKRLLQEHAIDPSRIISCSEIEGLPLLTRDLVRKHRPELVAQNAARLRPVAQRTSGTTGPPIEFLADPDSQALEFVYYWRHWSWAGFKLGDRFAELGSQYFIRRGNRSLSQWQPHLRRLMLNSGRISGATARELAADIRAHRPRFLKGMPSATHFLARAFEEAGVRGIRFDAVFTNGEVVTPQYRKSIESAFGCPVLDSYGHMERTAAISQCAEGGYHVVEDYGLLQFTNPRPGNGPDTMLARAVGTSLHNFAMPLVRYDLGDDIELFRDPRQCRCGRTFPLVKRILGRTRDVLLTPDGRHITSMFVLPDMVRGILLAQFVQETRRQILIKVVPDADWNDGERDRLLAYTGNLLGPEMEVRIEIVPSGEVVDGSGKVRPVMSRV